MRKTSNRWVLSAAFAAVRLFGQTGGEVKLDTPQARVLAVTAEPGQRSDPSGHAMDRVLVFRDAGQMTLKSQSGAIGKIELAEGDARWDPAGAAYTMENTSGHPIRFFEIELKHKAQGPAPVSKLDGPAVDPQHYKVEFENDQVRVLRIHFGPMEKGALHEHILNRVVCYLNDQGRTKAGDVRMAGAATHTEENAEDHPADRIAVELK
jgi:mannose-6-phosphate isomerase-like protein (cupin superfamily)